MFAEISGVITVKYLVINHPIDSEASLLLPILLDYSKICFVNGVNKF